MGALIPLPQHVRMMVRLGAVRDAEFVGGLAGSRVEYAGTADARVEDAATEDRRPSPDTRRERPGDPPGVAA
ncbi:hypothetical protein ACFV0T_01790 [Streptomyces sp. NPDC059582]|uniref:hypothetical protein n=1 Tax=Streptomyces sp. NPDC059582 TaxID=3346875 RepID=UPI00367E80D7